MMLKYVKVILDILCLLLVGSISLILDGVRTPFQRGFFCDDESLRHPYKDNTVPSWSLILAVIFPLLWIIITEFVLAASKEKCTTRWKLKGIPELVQNTYTQVVAFLFGAVTCQAFTDIGKYTVGRLRPHFIDVCKPSINCRDPTYFNTYITEFACMAGDEHKLKDMRLSFPSGHSSLTMYCMLFLSLYINSRFKWKGSLLLKHLLQFIAMGIAFFVALSRISDYKHHWSDVLSGSILGIVIAILTALYVSKLFPKTGAGYAEISSETPTLTKSSVVDLS